MSRAVTASRVLVVLVAALAAGGGCARKPPPALAAPAATVSLDYFNGSPLTGPLTQAVPVVAATEAFHVTVELWAMRRELKSDGFGAADLKLISSLRDGLRALPGARLTRGLRFAVDVPAQAAAAALRADATGDVVSLLTQAAALPPGATLVLDVPDDMPGSLRAVRIDIHHPKAAGPPHIELALRVTEAAEGRRMDQELAVLSPVAVGGGRALALMIPRKFSQEKDIAALCAVIVVAAGVDAPAQVEALKGAMENLKRSAERAAAEASGLAAGRWPGAEVALAALSDRGARRASLVYLGGLTEAPICQDMALVADDAVMDLLCAAIKQAAEPSVPAGAVDPLGWILDRTALRIMAQLMTAGKLPDDLSAVLIRHAGQVGRSASAMEDVLKGSAGPAELRTRLLAENFIQLEDNSPAARVRACDWLAARGAAPAGYDPLGPPRARREAMDRALTEAATRKAATAPAAGETR